MVSASWQCSMCSCAVLVMNGPVRALVRSEAKLNQHELKRTQRPCQGTPRAHSFKQKFALRTAQTGTQALLSSRPLLHLVGDHQTSRLFTQTKRQNLSRVFSWTSNSI